MQKVIANEQSYQSVYIDATANNWQERIVFHEPIFDDEIPGVIALKSLRLENCLGFVLAAPKNRIRYFREKTKELDAEQELGKKKPRDILKVLLSLCDEIDGTVVYIQDEKIGSPEENIPCKKLPPPKKKKTPKQKPNKLKQEADSFLDPLTKRQLVLKGPQYFDPSLPTYEEKDEKDEKDENEEDEDEDGDKMLSVTSQRMQSPAKGVYPENINPTTKSLWDSTISENLYELTEDNRNRWKLAAAAYEKLCNELEIAPYVLKDFKIQTDILGDVKRSMRSAFGFVSALGFASKPILHNVQNIGDNFFITAEIYLDVSQDDDEGILDKISRSGFKYAITSKYKSLVKKLDARTDITVSNKTEDRVTAYITYQMSKKDGMVLLGSDTLNTEQIRFGLMRLHRRYL